MIIQWNNLFENWIYLLNGLGLLCVCGFYNSHTLDKNSNFVGLHQNYLYIPQVNERVVRRWKYFFLIKDRN